MTYEGWYAIKPTKPNQNLIPRVYFLSLWELIQLQPKELISPSCSIDLSALWQGLSIRQCFYFLLFLPRGLPEQQNRHREKLFIIIIIIIIYSFIYSYSSFSHQR